MTTINNLLSSLSACPPAQEWAADKTWKEIYITCERGDWLLWLFKMTMKDNDENLRLLTLAKAHCANTVRHLMKDERSIKAVDDAILFGLGKLSLDELKISYKAAATAAATAATAAIAASYAAANAANAAGTADAADYAATAVDYADTDAAAAAKKKNQKETADICRKYLPIDCWNIQLD